HTTRYISPVLTQKVFANMRRVGKGFSVVETPLFESMLAVRDVAEEAEAQVPAQGDDVQEPAAEEVAPDVVPPTPTSPSPSSPVIPSSPPHQPPCPPQLQDAEGSSLLFQQVLNTCSALVLRVEGLENDKVAQQLEIVKLNARVKKLEKINKVKSSKLRRLKKVGTSQRVESSDDVENVFNQGRKIADIDQDEGIELVADQEKDAEVEGRRADKQAEIYNIDLDHSSKVLSMQEDDTKNAALDHVQSKEPQYIKRYHVGMKKKRQIESEARKNMIFYLKNTEGYKMDFFKGMKYDEILPIFPAKFDANMRFLFKSREEMEEEDEVIIKSINETPAQKAAKRRKLHEQAKEDEDLKKQLEVVDDEDDDVFIEATLIGKKSNVDSASLRLMLFKDVAAIADAKFSRHMTGNMSYLSDFQELNGGYVAFGGNPKGGKISGKGKIKTGKLDFKDVYFVKELKFNLFSVSQMCDKKNKVFFTDSECLVLSPDFKLPDESQVLLRVPRENNMYNVNLKDIVPSGDLTCLFAKATINESNLWHRRLGHINFKTINKLVKGNLVRGLPTKVFENNHTYVGCKKGKQHRASCKTKPVSSVNQPLFRLHIDLFRPTFVKSLNKKHYCLIITDDYSRFTWVFFLATKDETSPTLTNFITGLKNQLSLKVKVIRSDNEAKFKNSDLNQLCGIKGIKKGIYCTQDSSAKWLKQLILLVMSRIGYKAWKEANLQYVLFPVWSTGSLNPHNKEGDTAFAKKEHDAEKPESEVNLSSSRIALSGEKDDMTKKKDKGKSPVECFSKHRDLNAVFEYFSKDSSNDGSAASPIVPTAGQHYSNRTNPISTVGPIVNAAGHNYSNNTNPISTAGPSNSNSSPTHGQSSLRDTYQPPDMVEREDIDYSDHENVGTDADFNNLETSITVSPIPTTRIHNAHPISLIISNMSSTTQTRSMARITRDQGRASSVKMQKVWILVDLPHGKRAIGKSASTPIDIENPLLKDPDGKDIDVHIYRSMIGSLMYLTSSRPDIMFAFWRTVTVKSSNDVTRLQALVDKKRVVVTEAEIRDALHLDDAEGVDCLPNEEIFTELARIGYEKPTTKLTFYKAFFSSQWKFLIHTILQSMSAKRTSLNEFSSVMESVVICLSTGKGCSGVKTPLFEGMLVAKEPEEQGDVEEQGNEEEQGNADTTAE
nr:putative ribonuclease H-like domain-containing protein [Tanacetum cinerariifolium]